MSEFDLDKYIEEEEAAFDVDSYLNQEEAIEAPVEAPAVTQESPLPDFKPSGSGFLGATLDTKADPQALIEGLVEGARNVPVAGPLAEKAALAITGEDEEEFLARRDAAKEKYPVATGVGELVGTVGGFAAAPGALPAQLALSGADMAARGKSAAEMAGPLALETALGGTGKALSKLKGLKEKLLLKAGRQAEKAAGLQSSKKLRETIAKLEASGKLKPGEAGNRLLNDGIVQAGDTAADVANKSQTMLKEVGEEIGQVLSEVEVPTQAAQDALLREIDTDAFSPFKQKIQKKINAQVDLLEEAGEKIDGKLLNELKSEYGKEVKNFMDKSSNKAANKAIYRGLTNAIEETLGERELAKLRALNEKYSLGKMVEDPAREMASGGMSGLRKMGIATSVATGNPVVAGVLVADYVFDKYKPALLAAGLKKASDLGKYSDKFAEAAEKGGQAAIGALHYKLMQEDPEYRKKHNKEEK